MAGELQDPSEPSQTAQDAATVVMDRIDMADTLSELVPTIANLSAPEEGLMANLGRCLDACDDSFHVGAEKVREGNNNG